MVMKGGRQSKRNCSGRSGLRELGGGDFKDFLTGSVKTVKAVNLNSAHHWIIQMLQIVLKETKTKKEMNESNVSYMRSKTASERQEDDKTA